MLVLAAPRLLTVGPAGEVVHQASMTVVRHAHASDVHCSPYPIPIDLNPFPSHAKTGIHMWWRFPFAAFVLHGAAPMLFRGRPCSEEVVECCITIEGSRCCDMHITADLLYGASSAHITLHLNLAVRQGASIGLASENLPSSPMHSTLARRGVAMQGARCFAAQA